jgi:hypothetical protein
MDEQNQPNNQDSFLHLLLDDGLQSALPRIAELLINLKTGMEVRSRRNTAGLCIEFRQQTICG